MNEQRSIGKALLWGFSGWLLHCLAACTVIAILAGCIPRIVRLWEEADVDLPAVTVLVIQLSDYAVYYWYTFLFPLMLDCFLLIGLNLAPPKARWMARAWSGLVLAAALMFTTFVVFAATVSLDQIHPQAIALPLDGDAVRPATSVSMRLSDFSCGSAAR